MTDLRVAIAGAGGRMGAANIRAVTATPGIVVHAAFDRPGSPAIGRDAGEAAGLEKLGVAIIDDPEAAVVGADAIIDFTGPAVSVMLAELAAQRGLVDIIGTTGCSKEEDWAIAKAGSAGASVRMLSLSSVTGHIKPRYRMRLTAFDRLSTTVIVFW